MVCTSFTLPVGATGLEDIQTKTEAAVESGATKTETTTEPEVGIEPEVEAQPEVEANTNVEDKEDKGGKAGQSEEQKDTAKEETPARQSRLARGYEEDDDNETNPEPLTDELDDGFEETYTLEYGQKVMLSFTPEDEGVYRIWSSASEGDPVVHLFEDNDGELTYVESDDDSAGYPDFSLEKRLQVGQSYVYEIELISGEEGGLTVHFEKKHQRVVDTITLVPPSEGVIAYFDTYNIWDLTEKIVKNVKYTDGYEWSSALDEWEDEFGNVYGYTIGSADYENNEYTVIVSVNEEEVYSEQLPLIPLSDITAERTLAENNSITISSEWQYYTYESAEIENVVWQLEAEGDYKVETQIFNGYYVEFREDNRFIMPRTYDGNQGYIRIRRVDDEVPLNCDVTILKTEEVESVTIHNIETSEYLAGVNKYSEVFESIELKIVYVGGEEEIVPYNKKADKWIAVGGYEFYAGAYNGSDYYDSSQSIVKGENTVTVFSTILLQEIMDTSRTVMARQVTETDLTTLELGEEVSLDFADTENHWYWFTAPESKYYYLESSNDSYARFYEVDEQGNIEVTWDELSEGVKYLVRISNDIGVTDTVKLVLEDEEDPGFETKTVATIELFEADEVVVPFDYVDDDEFLTENIIMEVTYEDGDVWTGRLFDWYDDFGNRYGSEIEQINYNTKQYTAKAFLYNEETEKFEEKASEQFSFKTLDDMAVTLLDGDDEIILSQQWQYYKYEPTVALNLLQMATSDNDGVDIQIYNDEYVVREYFSGDSGQFMLPSIEDGKDYYIRLRYYGDEDEDTLNLNIKILQPVEIVSVEAIVTPDNYVAIKDTYSKAFANIKLKVTYVDESEEVVTFDDNMSAWVTDAGYEFAAYVSRENGYDDEYDDEYYDRRYNSWDRIVAGENPVTIYNDSSGEDYPNLTTFTARALAESDLETLTLGQEVLLGADETKLYWFTAPNTAEYDLESESGWINFWELDAQGNMNYVDGQLSAGRKYIAEIGNWSDAPDTMKLVRGEPITIINDTIANGGAFDKTYNFTKKNSRLELKFTPTTTLNYEIESHELTAGNDLDVTLYREVANERAYIGYDDDGGAGLNFKMSHQLQAGVTYVYVIRMLDRDDMGSFRVSLKVPSHTHVFDKEVIVRAATCGVAGIKRMDCECGAQGATSSIPATNRHSYGAWVTTRQPNALTAGVRTRTCSTCRRTETETIAKLKAFVKLNFSGTLPLSVKQSTTAVKVTMERGDSVASWKTSNSKVATVSKSGKITGKKAGNAKITVTLKSGVKKTFNVKVSKAAVKPKSVKLNSKKATLARGKSVKLTATVLPLTTREKVRFTTSNKNVATVSSKGVVKARRKGKATITVRVGNKKATFRVTVK